MQFDFEQSVKNIVTHKYYPIGIALMRGVLSFLVFALMQSTTFFTLQNSFYANVEDIMPVQEGFLFAFQLLFCILILNTVIGTFALFFRHDREQFLAAHPSDFDVKEERFALIRSAPFWVETGVFLVCFLFYGIWNQYVNFFSILPIRLPLWIWHAVLGVFHIVLVVELRFFGAIDSRKYWLDLPSKLSKIHLFSSLHKKKKRAYSYLRMILRLAVSMLVYHLGAGILTTVVIALISMVGVLWALLFLTPSVLVCFLLIMLFFYLRVFVSRASLIRSLKRVCAEHGYELFDLKRPYRSIFRDNASYTFAVKTKKKTFYCRLIACVLRTNKYTFSDNGILTRAFVFHIPAPRLTSARGFGYVQAHDRGNGDDRELFGFASEVDYTFEADGEKVLLLNLTPRRTRRKIGNVTTELDNGDKITEYTVFAANAFVRYLDRLSD